MDKNIVVITGGAKGIGGACSRLFHQNGYEVVIIDIDDQGAVLAEELGSLFIHCDVSKEIEVKTAFGKIQNLYGKVDTLVHSAGIQRYSTVTETSEEEWDLVMNVNLKSAFLC
jgi:NAD(P)-dependent dehydrogenase (short-subunit alcohol dehydrogenase family)